MRDRRGIVLLLALLVIAGCGFFVSSGFAIAPDTQGASQPSLNDAATSAPFDTTYLVTFNTTAPDQSPAKLQEAAAQSQQPFLENAALNTHIEVHNTFWLKSSAVVSVNSTAVDQSQLTAIDGVDGIYNHNNLSISADSNNTQSTPTDVGSQSADTTYGLDMIKAAETQNAFDTTGSGVDVAVLDTGLDPDHDAIDVGEWAAFDEDGNERSTPPNDPEGHGTHVGGTIAGDPVADTEIGVAPGATLHGVQVLDDNNRGSFAQVVAGMEWVIETDADDNGVDIDIMQMSLGSDDTTAEAFVEPVRNAVENDIIVSASVGNDGVNDSSSPGNIHESLAAGAVDQDNDVTGFSGGEWINTTEQWNQSAEEWPEQDPEWPDEYLVPDVVAPGFGIDSAEAGTEDSLTSKSGTSMSSPHVAGTAALLLAEGVDPTTAEKAIINSAIHPDGPDAYDNRYGHGTIDSFAAMTYAQSDVTVEGSVTLADADGNEVPADQVTVQTDFGNVSTVTDDDGEYTLPLTGEGGTQTVTADRLGWEPDTFTINVSDKSGTIEHDFSLDQQTLDADLQSTPPDHVSPGGSYDLTFDTLQTDAYIPHVEGTNIDGETVSADDFTISVNGDEHASGERYELTQEVEEPVSLSISTPEDFIGTVNVTHEFEGFDGSTINRTTTDTAVHPDPFVLPDDHEPDQLQRVFTLVTADTTVMLDPEHDFSATLDDDNPVGVIADQNITLRGDGGTATIALTDASTTEQTVGAGISANSTVENIAFSGSADVGITLADGTLSNVAVSGPTIGTEVTDVDIDDPRVGGNRITASNEILDLTIEDADTGLRITNDVATAQNVAVSASDTGVFVDRDSIISATNLSVMDSMTGINATDTSQMTLDQGTVSDTGTAFVFGEAATNVTVTNVTVDDTMVEFNGPKTATDVSVHHAGVTTSLNGSETHVTLEDTPPVDHPDYGHVGGAIDVLPQSADGTLAVQTTYDEHAARGAVTDTLSYYTLDDGSWSATDTTEHHINDTQVAAAFDTNTTAAIYGDGVPYINTTDVTVPDTIAPGDRLDAIVTLTNEGGASTTDTVSYVVDNSTVDTTDQSLAPGESTNVSLFHTPDDPPAGSSSYQISTLNTTHSGTYTVDPSAAGSDIAITDITLESEAASPGQLLNASVELANTGDLDGTHRVSLAADDALLAETAGYIATNNSETMTLSFEAPDEGEYDITVNDQSASTLTVESDESLLDEYPALLILAIGTFLFIIGLALVEWRYTDPVSATNR